MKIGSGMQLLATVIMLLSSQFVFAAADYAREKKWADEVVPGIVVGDPVYLELNRGHKFLSLFTEASNAPMGLVVIHGLGVHPDWSMVGTLRTQLAEHGYTTLSIQMPVLANDAKAEEYQATFAEAVERIAVAVDFLQAKGYKNIALVSHSMGSAMSRAYAEKNQARLAAWASLGLGSDATYAGIDIPVLDLYGEHDLPPVLNMTKKRAASLNKRPQSLQKVIAKSDHFYNNHEVEMVRAVKEFLDSVR